MSGFIKVSGAQRKIVGAFTKVNGVWKQATVVSNKTNGQWSAVWKNAFPAPTFLTYPSAITRGSTITWTTDNITGAAYEFQVKTNNGSWGTSTFYTTNTAQYTAPIDTTLITVQFRVRSVDPVDHSKQSSWFEGAVANLVAQKLPAPTNLSYTPTIARGDKVRVYWNVADVNTVYELRATYTSATSGIRDSIVFSNKVNVVGQTYVDYSVDTSTAWQSIQFRVYGRKTGYYDSDFTNGTTVTLIGQKLGTITSMNVPTPTKGETITISWGAVTNATTYALEVIYDVETTYTRIYTGGNRSFSYTLPLDNGYVQFRVKASAANYTDGDWHQAWQYGIKMPDPPIKTAVWTATSTHNWRPMFGGQWDSNDNYVIQGLWDETWGNYQGLAMFDYNAIKNTLAGRTITKVEVYFYRISTPHGYYSGQPILLYTHNYDSVPSGQPIMQSANNGPASSFALGDGKWVTVDNSVAERIRDGSAKGIGLYSPTGSYYLKMSTNVQLHVEYR